MHYLADKAMDNFSALEIFEQVLSHFYHETFSHPTELQFLNSACKLVKVIPLYLVAHSYCA